jgi:hypothetical protein
MRKRAFLAGAFIGASVPVLAGYRAPGPHGAPALGGPTLLTLSGPAVRANRGPFDPLRDQMLAKQKLTFEKAHAFDFAALAALPATTIRPTLEYDGKPHRLSGPLLTTVLDAAGVRGREGRLAMHAVDGYAPTISIADAARYGFIVATHLDGATMALGGLGPLWAVYDADRFPEMAAKPLDQRFAQCPWALFYIEVQA